MTESFLIEIVKQGGFAILAGVMFLLYRKDAKQWAVKQSESASAFMTFGSNTATALTLVSETMRQQSTILSRIEERLAESHLCPMTQADARTLATLIARREANDAQGRP